MGRGSSNFLGLQSQILRFCTKFFFSWKMFFTINYFLILQTNFSNFRLRFNESSLESRTVTKSHFWNKCRFCDRKYSWVQVFHNNNPPLRERNIREINAYPPLFWGKWPKNRIDKQKLYNLPLATIYISYIFADISAIIEISETYKWKIWHQEIFRFMVLWRILGTKGQRGFAKSQGFVANFTVLWRVFDTNVLWWISGNERIHSHSRVGLFSPQKSSKNLHFRCK